MFKHTKGIPRNLITIFAHYSEKYGIKSRYSRRKRTNWQ